MVFTFFICLPTKNYHICIAPDCIDTNCLYFFSIFHIASDLSNKSEDIVSNNILALNTFANNGIVYLHKLYME